MFSVNFNAILNSVMSKIHDLKLNYSVCHTVVAAASVKHQSSFGVLSAVHANYGRKGARRYKPAA